MSTKVQSKILYVGISGKKRHGKDSVAGIIHRELTLPGLPYRIMRRAFADSLKEEVACFLCGQLQGSPYWEPYAIDRMQELIKRMSSNNPGDKEPFRLLLQWWGTEFRRQMFREDYWIRALEDWVTAWVNALTLIKPTVVLIPDVRMENEAEFIRKKGGLLVKVERTGMVDTDTHASETALDPFSTWDTIVRNDGSLDDLRKRVLNLLDGLMNERLREMQAVG